MCNRRNNDILPYLCGVRYVLNAAGLFEVTSMYDGVKVVVFPATMHRVLGINPRATVGYDEIDPQQAEAIGLLPPGVTHGVIVA